MTKRHEAQEQQEIVRHAPGLRKEEIDRANARLRHFRGVAAGVMTDALRLWQEIWDAFQDPRSCEEILDGKPPLTEEEMQGRDFSAILEKLHLLGISIDYARRLCEGDIGKDYQDESEV